MSKGNIRHMFPGGNTSLGFYSFFDEILPQEEARRFMIIKGGPGVGKSTFMKKIAQEMVNRGYDAEYLHCASDCESLDGVVFPEIKVAIIDGTSPHIVDPKNPGAVDEIINLGEYWNEEDIRKNKDAILDVNRKTKGYFARAYRYLKAAAQFYEDTAVINSWALDRGKVNRLADRMIKEIFSEVLSSNVEGRSRKLFASAITPQGLKNFLPSLISTGKVYSIKGSQGTGTDIFLERIRESAVRRGYYTEAFYCAFNPAKLEHLIIPEKDVSFTTCNKYHDPGVEVCMVFDFNRYLDGRVIKEHSEVLEYNARMFDELLEKGINEIRKAKACHDELEDYYIPCMDFDRIQKCREATLARILGYAGESI